MATAPDDSTTSTTSETVRNAVLGAVVGTVLSFLPLSTALGGAVAGYLENGTDREGAKVGGLAGTIMILPFVVVAYLLVVSVGILGARLPAAFGILVVLVILFVILYTLGLALLGGYLGSYAASEL